MTEPTNNTEQNADEKIVMPMHKVNMIYEIDFSKIVSKIYGRPYTFQQQDDGRDKDQGTVFIFTVPVKPEMLNDYENNSIPEEVNGDEMGVSFESWLKRDPKQHLKDDEDGHKEYAINLFWDRNFYPSVYMIIDDLHKKGILSEGKYIMYINW